MRYSPNLSRTREYIPAILNVNTPLIAFWGWGPTMLAARATVFPGPLTFMEKMIWTHY